MRTLTYLSPLAFPLEASCLSSRVRDGFEGVPSGGVPWHAGGASRCSGGGVWHPR